MTSWCLCGLGDCHTDELLEWCRRHPYRRYQGWDRNPLSHKSGSGDSDPWAPTPAEVEAYCQRHQVNRTHARRVLRRLNFQAAVTRGSWLTSRHDGSPAFLAALAYIDSWRRAA